MIANPDAFKVATEEFVRYFSPAHGNARNVGQDVVVEGQHLLKGERILLAISSANRDPEIFEQPEDLILDRFPNRHIGFGAGMHRCLGSFLARAMFETMLKEVLSRMPDYTVIEEDACPYKVLSSVNGWINMPITFTPGNRISTDPVSREIFEKISEEKRIL